MSLCLHNFENPVKDMCYLTIDNAYFYLGRMKLYPQ
jgi:hypothetical protein